MDNNTFLEKIEESFLRFLDTGSRSNAKLVVLHGAIAEDLANRLANDYTIASLGYKTGKETNIQGRYIDKRVDITILKGNKPVAGIGVKFIMGNYSQNSNNYFENMLGETANIKSNRIPYFQIFIIPHKLPYYKNGGAFDKWEEFKEHHLIKYQKLSSDDEQVYMHTPTKTLIYVLDIPDIEREIKTRKEYVDYYKSQEKLTIKPYPIDPTHFKTPGTVIVNDYEDFITKVVHRVLSE